MRSVPGIVKCLPRYAALCASLVLPGAGAWAQAVPPGWKIVTGGFRPFPGESAPKATGSCQIALPPDWTPSPLVAGEMDAPEPHHSSAIVSASRPGVTFAREVKAAKDNQKAMPVKGQLVIEDSSQRYWTQARYLGATHWDVTAPGNPVCNLKVEFRKAAAEATARKIVMSLKPAK
jgi:hypothetical protein